MVSLATRYRHSFVRNGERLAECITCKTVKPIKELQAGHFISRRVNALRFDPENLNVQCYSCNVMKYGEQYQYAKEIDLLYGDGKAQELHDRRFETHKFTIPELEEVIRDAQEEIKYYENRDN